MVDSLKWNCEKFGWEHANIKINNTVLEVQTGTQLQVQNFRQTVTGNHHSRKGKNLSVKTLDLTMRQTKHTCNVEHKIIQHKHENYSAFQNLCPTTSILSFLDIFRIIYGQKIKIFNIALPARSWSSFYWAILKI